MRCLCPTFSFVHSRSTDSSRFTVEGDETKTRKKKEKRNGETFSFFFFFAGVKQSYVNKFGVVTLLQIVQDRSIVEIS